MRRGNAGSSNKSSCFCPTRFFCRIRNLAILFISLHIIFVILLLVLEGGSRGEDVVGHVKLMDEFISGSSPGRNAYNREARAEETSKNIVRKKRTKEEATNQMLSQPSYWVKSQQKLKEDLLKLQSEQQSYSDKRGVPILHHYLGKDVPVSVDDINDQTKKHEWIQLVKQKQKERKVKEEEMEERKKLNLETQHDIIEDEPFEEPQRRKMDITEQKRLLKELLKQEQQSELTEAKKNKNQQQNKPILTAYFEPIDQTQWYMQPLPIRTAIATRSISYPQVSSCKNLPSQLPIDTYPDDDPFLPWIHDIVPSSDGTYITIVAQNKRRCQSGKLKSEIKKHMQPQSSLFQSVSVKRVNVDYDNHIIQDDPITTTASNGQTSRYRLASYQDADPDGMETRFICRFKDTSNNHNSNDIDQYHETLSQFLFNYDYHSWRKRHPSTFTYEGFDNHIIWSSQLLFRCPVPTNELQKLISSGSSVKKDYATLFLDLIPIRTPPRYVSDGYLPSKYGRENTFNATEEWGNEHLLPKIEHSGRWENLPICKPSLMQYNNDQNVPETRPLPVSSDTSSSLAASPQSPPTPKKHNLIACTWASSSFETRGGKSRNDDGQRRLREWIEFHLLIGFDHIYVYDNSGAFTNTTSLYEVTKLFPSSQVTHIPWPAKICNNNRGAGDNKGERSSQYAAESSCRLRFGVHSKWIANIDIDEYLVPMGKFESMTDVLKSLDYYDDGKGKEKKEEDKPKILTFSSMPAKPRLDLLQNPTESNGTCGGRRCFTPIIPDNVTVLQSYNCDLEKPPRTITKSAEKQIYQSDYVLLHFVHYSSITVKSVLGPEEAKAAGINYIRRYKEPHNHIIDEVNEATMIHSRAIATYDTTNWERACKLPRPLCKVGVPFPPGIAPNATDRNYDENGNIYRDANGFSCNCYSHEKIEKYWVPKLEKAIKDRNGKI